MDEGISFTIDFGEVETADEILKTLIIGRLHDEAGDLVTTWTDVPQCIRDQWNSTRGAIQNWATTNAPSLPDPQNPPQVHATWSFRVPDGLIPWSDGGDSDFPRGASIAFDWVNPNVLIDRAPTAPGR